MTFSQLTGLQPRGELCYAGSASPDKGARVYGGQFLAQCLAASQATVTDDRLAGSLHGYFLRQGDVDLEMELQVERLRDGRSFSFRQVVAEQQGNTLFRMLVSHQVREESPEYSGEAMPEVPPPEEVTFTYDDFTLAETGDKDWHGADRPMDIRYINPPTVRGVSVTEPQLMWMRIREDLPDAPHVHQAGLAYLSDSTLVDHVMLPLGMRWQDADLIGASLDHAMWFHRPARADEWLLFVQTVEATGAGRGLARGRMFTQQGELAATCMQEGLIRWRDPTRALEVHESAIDETQSDTTPKSKGREAWQRASGGLRNASSKAGDSARAAKEITASTVRSGAARATQGVVTAKEIVVEKGGKAVRSGATGAATGFGVAHEALSGFAQNLDWSNLPREYLTKFVTAGTRGMDRSLEQAHLVWETIPGQLRAMGPEEVAKRLDGFDWSHITPHSKGGSNDAANGIFELASLNRSRGAEQMTPAELLAAQQVLAGQAFQAAIVEVASQAFTGAMVGAAVGCVISALEYGLEYQRGEISREEMYRRIGKEVAIAGGVGAAVSGVMAVVAMAFPPLIPLAAPLMLPLAVLGFCAVGGKMVRIAKGWYELMQSVYDLQLPGVSRVALSPPRGGAHRGIGVTGCGESALPAARARL